MVKRVFLLLLGGFVPAWSGLSRLSSWRSSITGRLFTFGIRSFTTLTSFATSRIAGRSSSRPKPTRRSGHDRFLRARRRSVRPRGVREAEAEHDRRDVPARDQGARSGAALRSRGLHGRARRPRGARRGRRDDGRGSRFDRARRVGRGRRAARALARPEARVHHADDALGRRDDGDHRRASPSLPGHPRPEEGRHLLRDLQPAVGGEGDDRAHRGCSS